MLRNTLKKTKYNILISILLCNAYEIKKLIDNEVQKVNDKVARVEQIKKYRLIDVLLTAEDDEMTATMKLKRGVLEKNYKSMIDSMYS